MTFKLSQRSLDRLRGVHPDLVKVVQKAIELSTIDFMVVEGLRTRDRQAELLKAGASQTMNSRHLTGHAVDLAPIVGGQLRWDFPLFDPIGKAMKEAAAFYSVKIIWGGDWKRFIDKPHFELDRKLYA